MDIIKTAPKKSIYRRYWYVPIIILVVALTATVANRFRSISYLVQSDDLLTDTVVMDDFSVTTRGYGRLVAQDVFWVGAESAGTVSNISVRPGDHVKPGDILVKLINPQLLQELKEAELEVAARQADLRANQLIRESELLDLMTEAANAEIDHQTAKMELDAKTRLVERGLEIISRLEYEQTQLAVQKFLQRWQMQEQRVIQREQSIQAIEESEEARLSQTRNELDRIREQVAKLTVRAGVEGIVQELDLALGQKIDRDNNITRIAQPDQLVAQVKIQELQVNDIQLGMPATVDTRTSKIPGVVSRIDPTVVDGSVLVEIELQGELPAGIRPDLNIEATISVSNVPNTLIVRRPASARPQSADTVYRLSSGGGVAERVNVRFGQASTSYIEVVEGLLPGDRIVVSDTSGFSTHERILVR
ncbi:MAG: hypothetical protein CMQ46_03425 [Gammaproteobacteria bacterium]|nr:hypothetical protein [Gammaproteobacteria bacterium]MBJ54299.1 hypothetical protein [Gammaproteobacteria bacterium]HBN14441.1 hypothetical protein [Pseudohongiella sp.]|tara:strand:- start:723 stop:1979 length:1257 start_codon:yes stop_codon:yes gene_type:complete